MLNSRLNVLNSNGAGPRGFLPSLSGYMLSSAATFGFFMSIGTVIRTQDDMPGLVTAEATRAMMMRSIIDTKVAQTAGGVGGSPVYREWQRRRALETTNK